jgi:flagellar hook assembly protein FlgD
MRPDGFRLLGNYPNPFNPCTRIAIWLPVESEVTVFIYDLQGHLVQHLLDASVHAGLHQILWEGCTDSGEQAASGVYLVRVSTENQMQSAKMMLIR